MKNTHRSQFHADALGFLFPEDLLHETHNQRIAGGNIVVLAPVVHHVVKLILRIVSQLGVGEGIIRGPIVGFYVFPMPGEHGQRTCRADNVIASLFVMSQPGIEPVPAVRNFLSEISAPTKRQCRQHIDLRNKCGDSFALVFPANSR